MRLKLTGPAIEEEEELRGFKIKILPNGNIEVEGQGLVGEECIAAVFNQLMKDNAEILEVRELPARHEEPRQVVETAHVNQ